MSQSGGLGSILPIALVGGLAYWLYESGMLNSLLGSPAPAAAAPTVGTNPVPATTTPATSTPPASTSAAPPPCSGAGILAPLLASVQKAQGSNGANFGVNLPGTLTIDEWGYYLNQLCSGMADQYKLNADALFPGRDDRGGPLNWSAFSGYAQQAGLSALPVRRGPVGRPASHVPGTPVRRRVRRGPVLIGTNPVVRRSAA